MAITWKDATTTEKFFYIYFAVTFIGAIILLVGFHPKEFGTVVQGRTIDYDPEKMIVTVILDAKQDAKKPDYSILPPAKFKLPEQVYMRGPEPRAGKRAKLDLEKNEIVIFDDATQNFLKIPIKVVEKKEGVRRDDPLVKDKKFPIIDKEKSTITLYSARLRVLSTIEVPREHIDRPPKTWDAGDEVRIYYHPKECDAQTGICKAHKFMNITRTDIFKK
ncbi:MAG: DUF4881 domain-containing protein [Thermodesulfovibrio sp.]|nr:DUF4881 domain-containing protein [Thermodesulfovibrio sp.]